MSKKNNQRLIINCVILLGLIMLGSTCFIQAEEQNRPFLLRTNLKYKANKQRDPFVQPAAGRFNQVMEQVDIESLKLTGIIRNPNQATALFTAQTGPRFGYLLKDGLLYRDNHRTVTGIAGEIINPKEVILKQDGREIVFRLR